MSERSFPLRMTPTRFSGSAERIDSDRSEGPDPRYEAAQGDKLIYEFEEGSLASGSHVTFDVLLETDHNVRFQMALKESSGSSLSTFVTELLGDDETPAFVLLFDVLPGCTARIRLPLETVSSDRRGLPRHGGWLIPRAGGDRVNVGEVDRIELEVYRTGRGPARWSQSPIEVTASTPKRIHDPTLPDGPLVDEFGQYTVTDGARRTTSVELLRSRNETYRSSSVSWPDSFSAYGGWRRRQFEDEGFFRVRKEDGQWWLVDPDGHPFWSAGINAVDTGTRAHKTHLDIPYDGLEAAFEWLPAEDGRYEDAYTDGSPPTFNLVEANLIRSFGPETYRADWRTTVGNLVRKAGFNTVGVWSDYDVAREHGLPYTRVLDVEYENTPTVFRDFPDVFHDSFEPDIREIARQLSDSADDPLMIGYFVDNEPMWCFANNVPAAEMLKEGGETPARRKLASFLRQRYDDIAAFQRAWETDLTFADVATGAVVDAPLESATDDLETFSGLMVDRYYGTLCDACRDVDPNHLNLGLRLVGPLPKWQVVGMQYFDVFSVNWYGRTPPAEHIETISTTLDVPILIGEWGFGSFDAGLPGLSLCQVDGQRDRTRAVRRYLEHAARNPYCVGCHFFQLYDQPALGGPRGENRNTGLLDVCGRPYETLLSGFRKSHERLYRVASGESEPFDREPEYVHIEF